MKCSKCGTELSKSANFCRVCGSQINSESINENHSTIQKSDNSENLKKELINDSSNEKLSSSKEIKKILDEMSSEETKSDEPTMAIPSELINKYCKKKKEETDIIVEKTENVIENTETELNHDSKAVEKNNESSSDTIKTTPKVPNDNIKNENSSDTNEKNNQELQQMNNKDEIKNNINDSNINDISNDNKIELNIEKNNEIITKKISEAETFNNIKDVDLEKKDNELIFGEVSSNDKKNYGKNFFIFFIILVCLCSICYLVYVLYSSRNELEKIGNEKNTLQEEINNIKNNTLSENQSTNGVIFNGYKFSTITDNYSIVDDSLVLKRNNSTYAIKINKNISFESIKLKKETYRQQLINDGYNILSYGNKHIDNNDYYVFVVRDKKMKKYLIAYSKLDDESVIAFIISNNDNNVDYNLLSQANIIISSVSKTINDSSNDLKVFIEKK